MEEEAGAARKKKGEETLNNNQKDFVFELTHKGKVLRFQIPVDIPFDELRVSELAQRILSSFQLPILFEDGELEIYYF